MVMNIIAGIPEATKDPEHPCDCAEAPEPTAGPASEQSERSHAVSVAILATVSVCGALLLVIVISGVIVCTSLRHQRRVDVECFSTQVRCS